ncbi:Putative PWWP domain-containing protein [Septoria linicola]|uniref:PWWP domain-containing protein n=1 Tax=Septoria linicola TaxID=215465 RepID=A0A9Q9AZC4_9PEZI|nr:putative PWWP domain-containing protein [Septoria linicola]USW54642.1 Putative PWWP domain-containing protein [Septoria linicola]
MADEASTTVPVDAQAPATTTTDSTEPTTTTQTNGDSTAPEAKQEESEAPAEHTKSEDAATDGDNTHEPEQASAEPSSDATPGSNGKDKKRKSTGGVPEHKNKKLNKKKSMPTLRLECQPGQFYWARLKGYPPWPAIICDEEMLPESLLATRPVSTARPDGSLRDDFKEGGKNAKERTFPIMFLHTNEFQWMVNTSLTPLEPEECLTLPKTKMTKALQEAYKVASEGHDIDFFKDVLRQHQQELEAIVQAQVEYEERLAAEAAARAEAAENGEDVTTKDKAKKKAPRKNKAADEDVDMEDADAPKSTKKRKKADESDADAPKPKKTPKVTKLNAPKTPNGDASAKKSKPKKKVVSAPKSDEEEKPQMTEEERLAQREKAVLYLRHRLQKGFLSRDQAPKEDEMASMAEFFTQLEGYENLEPSIIRTTKIHKVLKAIVKLASVPKDDEFDFKRRSSAMLEVWNKRLEADGDSHAPSGGKEKSAAPADDAAKTNGDAPAAESAATTDAVKEIAQAGTTKEEAEEGAAKPVEGQEIEMQDAEASETPAETETEKKTDAHADQIEDKVEAVTLNAAADTEADAAAASIPQ